jgi:hypothetical protein
MTTPISPTEPAPGHPAGASPEAPAPAPSAHAHNLHDGHAHGSAATEPEVIGFGKVITVGVLSVVLFVIGSIWALQIRTVTEKAMNPTVMDAKGNLVGGSRHTAVPAGYGAEEQGIVDQVPFELNTWVAKDHAASTAKLKGYGWVDKQAGVIHVPIERAMDLVVAESAK